MGGSSRAEISLRLKVWRQKNSKTPGAFTEYELPQVSTDMSFLEMLDMLNEQITKKNEDPIAFDHDCREGICGSCSLVINGNPHGPETATATCQLHMRKFKNGDTIVVEPFRATAFPVHKDLSVDRSALDRIVQAGGFISVATGNAQDANNIPINKEDADEAFSAAACIGCGACVAACKNASAMLFTAAKFSHLALLPQGAIESEKRALSMTRQMDVEGFGNCTNTEACSAACPKEISQEHIARFNRHYIAASFGSKKG